MKFRIVVLIPLLLAIFTLATSIFMYANEINSADKTIRNDTLNRTKLDITRLQNVLYNITTESADNLQGARLNISITAMDSNIRCLILADENNIVLVANHYTWERKPASQQCHYTSAIANNVRKTNDPSVFFTPENDSLLNGYYPVVLQIESKLGLPIKRSGVLYIESSIASSLVTAFNEAIYHSTVFASVMLAASALIALLLHKLVSRRLVRLAGAAKALADGNLDARAALSGTDELAQLGATFDEMVARIKNDISRRKQAEANLLELNETLEQRVNERTQLLQQAQHLGGIGNWHLDITTGNLDWSDEIYRIFGYEPHAVKPSYEQFYRAVHPDDVAHIKASEQQAFSQNARHSIDHRIVLPNGEIRWVHEEAAVTRDDSGAPVTMTGTVQDITERKLHEQNLLHAKEEAERANKAKSDFLSSMSHELRTPMNAILGFSQLLHQRLIDNNNRSYVDEILQAGDHLLALIEELLDLGRIESDRMTIALNNVDITPLIDHALTVVSPLHKQKQLQINNHCPKGIQVLADDARLRQVLVNLLANAAKYNRQNGSITLTCEHRAQGRIRFLITDTGDGIQPGDIKKLFTAFERFGEENSNVEGAGIGLAVSRQLIELMGGKIGVESVPGKGSTFWIELSGADQKMTKDSNMHLQPQVSDQFSSRVLYVEDNAANLRLVEAMLKHQPDITLLSAKNGRSGLELAQQYIPDVILLDIHLPDIDGYKVLRSLQDNPETKHIPVIAISADAMQMDIEKGMKAGFREYLTKPVKLEELVHSIRTNSHC